MPATLPDQPPALASSQDRTPCPSGPLSRTHRQKLHVPWLGSATCCLQLLGPRGNETASPRRSSVMALAHSSLTQASLALLSALVPKAGPTGLFMVPQTPSAQQCHFLGAFASSASPGKCLFILQAFHQCLLPRQPPDHSLHCPSCGRPPHPGCLLPLSRALTFGFCPDVLPSPLLLAGALGP